MRQKLLVGTVLVLALAVGRDAVACSCYEPTNPDYRAALRTTDAVFRGTVVRVQDLLQPPVSPSDGAPLALRIIVFDADASWAGVKSRRVFIFTGVGGGDCGFDFKVGQPYVVWAKRNDSLAPNELSTGICSFTRALDEAGEQLRQLGKPRAIQR